MKETSRASALRMYHGGERNFANIARELNISRERVRQLLNEEGIKSDAFLTQEDKRNIKIIFKRTRSVKVTAEEIGVSKATIMKFKKENFPHLKSSYKREPRRYTKEVLIKTYHEANGSYSEMTRILKTSDKSTISKAMKVRGLNKQYPGIGRKTRHETK